MWATVAFLLSVIAVARMAASYKPNHSFSDFFCVFCGQNSFELFLASLAPLADIFSCA